jgi:hypothetical protein
MQSRNFALTLIFAARAKDFIFRKDFGVQRITLAKVFVLATAQTRRYALH